MSKITQNLLEKNTQNIASHTSKVTQIDKKMIKISQKIEKKQKNDTKTDSKIFASHTSRVTQIAQNLVQKPVKIDAKIMKKRENIQNVPKTL